MLDYGKMNYEGYFWQILLKITLVAKESILTHGNYQDQLSSALFSFQFTLFDMNAPFIGMVYLLNLIHFIFLGGGKKKNKSEFLHK